MSTAQLVKQSLRHYWRTNLAVVFGVAIAVAILAGALLVGDSVRASLRDLFLQRLGQTDHVITATGFFREQLAEDIRPQLAAQGFSGSCPLIELEGSVSRDNGARAGSVRVYGVDQRFWQFHGSAGTAPPENREVLVSESLARELDSRAGEPLLIRIEKHSDVPIESLYGNKDELGRTLRLTTRETLSAEQLGEFSTRPQQSGVRAVFVPLRLLQQELEQPARVNTILISSSTDTRAQAGVEKGKALTDLLSRTVQLEDYNIKLRVLDQQRGLSLERTSTLLDDKLAESGRAAAESLPAQAAPVLSYVANQISRDQRTIPYSLVTAIDDGVFERLRGESPAQARNQGAPIVLNEWAARDLDARVGDLISLEYYVWHEDGRLETKTAQFSVSAIVPLNGLAADRDLVPEYPGISESDSLSDWNPPFPIQLDRIRPKDEDYWKQYRTTPKAFIPLSIGQKLWQSRFGKLTSLRITPANNLSPAAAAAETLKSKLKAALDPAGMGIQVIPARAQGLESSRGATDFGEYFLYFSFFLVVSALLLVSLLFKLGTEQRLREIGTLQAIGFSTGTIRRLFLLEAAVLALAGSVLGLVGAIAYGYLIMIGLRTWWVDAVGTTLLRLHVSPLSLALGAVGGSLAVVISIVWTLRVLGKASTRSLLTGQIASLSSRRRLTESPRLLTASRVAILFTAVGIILLLGAQFKLIPQAAGFFGGGASLLVALLCYLSAWLRRPVRRSIQGTGWPAVIRLGFRNATYRPGRSVLCIALIAVSTFIIVAVDSFRRSGSEASQDKKSGTGGFTLMAGSLLPLVHDPNTPEGREALDLGNRTVLDKVSFSRFRLRPGDDASCLNLYAPSNPRILAATDNFVKSNRFAFQSSISGTSEEKDNPWLLLNRELEPGVIPVIADANSISYVLHLKLGEEFVLHRNEGPVRLRIVGALADSIFQSELVMSEKNFLRLFPDQQGYRVFLIEAPGSELSTVTAALEERLSDFGFDVKSTGEQLANFHRVENTYLSTFQMLGGLGLALGTLGMAAVLLRNVFERRKELALLRAVGYRSAHFMMMVIAENALLLLLGLFTGGICALLAIAPVFFERGGRLPNVSLAFLLLAVLISGLIASLAATLAALRSPLLPALRAE